MSLVSLDDIRAASRRLTGVVRHTPLVNAGSSAEPIWLKCENLQLAGAFKMRGAYNLIAGLSDEERSRGVITYSSGNHGQAVALAARMLGIRAVVVMPTSVPAVKVEGVRGYGAEVQFAGTTSADRKQHAEEEAARRGLVVVPPFDHPAIIAGQGTTGLEIVEDLPDVRAVFVPIGGGGLLAGVAAAVKRLRPETRVVGVEPEGSACMQASLRAGAPVTLDATRSIADGLLPLRPGDLTFAHARALVDDVITVSDEAIVEATRWLVGRAKLVVEPSGAASLAGWRASGLASTRAHPVAVVLSGGNIAIGDLAAL